MMPEDRLLTDEERMIGLSGINSLLKAQDAKSVKAEREWTGICLRDWWNREEDIGLFSLRCIIETLERGDRLRMNDR